LWVREARQPRDGGNVEMKDGEAAGGARGTTNRSRSVSNRNR